MNITKVGHEPQGGATSQLGGDKRGDWSHSWSVCSAKETLISIPLSYVTVIRAYTTRVAKQHNKLYINILL